MRNRILPCLLLCCLGFISCNRNQKNAADQAVAEKPVSVQCYVSIYEKDTVSIQINPLKSGKLTGNMDMKFLDMPVKTGKSVVE